MFEFSPKKVIYALINYERFVPLSNITFVNSRNLEIIANTATYIFQLTSLDKTIHNSAHMGFN